MKQSLLALLCLLSIGISTRAQQDTTKPPEYGWKHTLVGNITLTQIAFTDWAAGGDNALAYGLSLEGKSVQDLEKTNWETQYKFGFGQARLGDKGVRKTEDKIDLQTILTYKVGTYINPYAAATFRTQFAKGYKYEGGPGGADLPVSKFFDPAYLTQSIGVGYQPQKEIKTRLGIALREVFASDFAPIYTDEPGTAAVEKSRVEGGLESVTDIELKLEENILFTSKLELFAPFNKLDRVVVRNDNAITAKVSKLFNVILSVSLLNDAAISPKTQVKQVLAIGFSYSLL